MLESKESPWEQIWPILWKTELKGQDDLFCSKNVNTNDGVFFFFILMTKLHNRNLISRPVVLFNEAQQQEHKIFSILYKKSVVNCTSKHAS